MKKFRTGFIIFLLFYLLAYCVFNKARAEESSTEEPKGPTITIPYTDEQMCKTFLRAEICDMSLEEQEKFLLEMFRALIDQRLKENLNKEEEVDICFKETSDGKLMPCKGTEV